LCDRESKLFWDTTYPLLVRDGLFDKRVAGAAYFTDFAGSDERFHAARVLLRKYGFDPQVIKESSPLAKHRGNRLATDAVLEKPKGLDIGLTVRILEDAQRDIFDTCYLFTSDVDYIPVIDAMRRMGKRIIVFGYLDGLGNQSPMAYVPDQFIDLAEQMKNYQLKA
jgi:uncharacterized LabA/DUF88 family protein